MRRGLLTLAARVLEPQVFARIHGIAKLRYLPRINSPRTFTDFLLHKRVFDRDGLISVTADKFELREYVTTHVGGDLLPALYEVIEEPTDINVEILPSAYVMKGTHGCGWNRIVTESDLTNCEAQALASRWLASNYYWKRQEWAYKNLKPRIIFEENLSPGKSLDDYKVFVFNGIPRLVQVDRGRFTHHRRSLYTPEWRRLAVSFEYEQIQESIDRPAVLESMLEIASVLGQPFKFVRVDFYWISPDSRLVVGEMTHYPESGVVRFFPNAFDYELGQVWAEGRPIGNKYLAT